MSEARGSCLPSPATAGKLPAWAQRSFRGSSKAAVVTKITEGCRVSPLSLPGPNSPSCHAYHLPTDTITRPHCQGHTGSHPGPLPLQDRGHAEGSRSGPPTGLFHSHHRHRHVTTHGNNQTSGCYHCTRAGHPDILQGGDGPGRISVLNLTPPCPEQVRTDNKEHGSSRADSSLPATHSTWG